MVSLGVSMGISGIGPSETRAMVVERIMFAGFKVDGAWEASCRNFLGFLTCQSYPNPRTQPGSSRRGLRLRWRQIGCVLVSDVSDVGCGIKIPSHISRTSTDIPYDRR